MTEELLTTDRGWHVHSVLEDGVDPEILRLLEELGEHEAAPGLSDVGVRNVLYSLVLSLRPQRVLEIGGHIGFGALTIAAALKRNGFGRLVTLEPADHYYDILERSVAQAEVEEQVRVIKGFSHDEAVQSTVVAEGPYQIIFVDGSHDYADVRADLVFALSTLSRNGLVLCHDSSEEAMSYDTTGRGGVRRAVRDLALERPDVKPIFMEYPLWLNPCGMAMLCKQSI